MRIRPQLSPPAFYALIPQSGISDEAAVIQQSWHELFAKIMGSVAMGTQYRLILSALNTLSLEAAGANWDGYGASPVNQKSLAYAERIAKMLPVTVPAPEVSVDPDGEVSFDWQPGPRRSLSMSIDQSGTLRYASIIGGSEHFGLEPWRDGLPESILHVLQKVAIQEATK